MSGPAGSSGPADVAGGAGIGNAYGPPRRRLYARFVRGPAGDPSWARPSLLALLAATAALYLWGLGASGWANAYYSAAVQAGTQSWKAFFFGSFDAANAITVDKTPASLWIMELSGRIFGVNSWSILVPQALLGVAAVGLLYATIRRWFGPAPALLAGAVLASTPVATLMFRFNNPDALLVLLLVAAAYATVRALERAETYWLLLAGTAVGFGFLTKMLQALLVVPALALAYLIAAPTSLRRRLGQLLLAGLAVVASAGWWVAIVELVPAGSRPYIGGSQNNSVLELTLGYNGLGRLTGDEVGSVGGGQGGGWGQTGWLRLFDTENGGQASWLLPAALLLLVAVLLFTVRAPRTDRARAAMIIWGGWLLTTAVTFSFMAGIFHAYYNVALAPEIGAVVGVGAAALWKLARQRKSAQQGARDGHGVPAGDPAPAGPRSSEGDGAFAGAAAPAAQVGLVGEAAPAGQVGLVGEAAPAGQVGLVGEAAPAGQVGSAGATAPAGQAGLVGGTAPAGPAFPAPAVASEGQRNFAIRVAASLTLAAAVAATAIWSWTLLGRSAGWYPWLRVAALAVGLVAAVALAAYPLLENRMSGNRLSGGSATGRGSWGSARARNGLLRPALLAAAPVAAILVALAGPVAYSLQTASTPHTGSIVTAGPAVTGGGPGGRGGPGGPGGGGPRFGGRNGGGAPWGTPPGAAQGGTAQGGATQGGMPGGTAQGGATQGGMPGGTAQGGVPGGMPGGSQGSGSQGGGMPGGFPGGATGRPNGGMGGLLNAGTPGANLTALLRNGGSYTWTAAAVGANSAAGYQLAAGAPVMAIGGFNGSDAWPTLEQFKKYVADGKIHYFIGGGFGGMRQNGGSSYGSQISEWVTENFAATTVDGVTLYDLTKAS